MDVMVGMYQTRNVTKLFFLLVALVTLWACGNFGNQSTYPGVDGKVTLGKEVFLSAKASRIVVMIYKEVDFDAEKGMPKADTTPVVRTQITNIQGSLYNYQLTTTNNIGKIYVFAFLDQDNSGAEQMTELDAFGHTAQPVQLGGYRLKNIEVVLDKVYRNKKDDSGKPGVEGEIVLAKNVKISDRAKNIQVMLFQPEDFDTKMGMPKPEAKAIKSMSIKALKAPPYEFSIVTEKLDRLMYLYILLDQDNSGGVRPSPGDVFGVSVDSPIFIGSQRTTGITITLSEIYRPKIAVAIKLEGVKVSSKAQNIVFGMWKVRDMESGGYPKAGRKALLRRDISDLQKNVWSFQVEPGKSTEDVTPFAYLDQDGSGDFSEGDAYARWSGKTISLKVSTDDKVQLVIKNIYKP